MRAEVTRKMGSSEQTFYRWKKKFGGLMPSEVRKLRQLEEEMPECIRVDNGPEFIAFRSSGWTEK